jgi:hypothetical protein
MRTAEARRKTVALGPHHAIAGAFRIARALLKLARAANIGKRFEVGRQNPIPNNMAAIRKVLEEAGIKFIDRGKSGGPGVRLRA